MRSNTSLGHQNPGASTTCPHEEVLLLCCRAQGVQLIFDVNAQGDGLTWTADANLFKTQLRRDPGLVDEIIARIPVITDANDAHYLTPDEFDIDSGAMTWWAALAWTRWLNDTRFAGGDRWGLFSAAPCDGGRPRAGRQNPCNDMGRLCFGGRSPGAVPKGARRRIKGLFYHLQDGMYWSRTEYAPNAKGAWLFCTQTGNQYFEPKHRKRLAWAVHPGAVAATACAPSPGLDEHLGALLGLRTLDVTQSVTSGARPG